MEMQAQDMLKILSSREQFTGPDKRRVRVTGVTRYTNPEGTTVYITNYAAMAPDGVAKALEHLELGEIQQAGNTNLTSNQRLTDFIPAKGEIVEILVDWVGRRDNPDEKVLRVVSVNPIATGESAKTDFVAMFAAKAGAGKPSGEKLVLENAGK